MQAGSDPEKSMITKSLVFTIRKRKRNV